MNRLLPSLLLLLSAPLSAQGLLIGPDPSATTGPNPPSSHGGSTRPGVHIVSTKIAATIVDGVASTTIDQVIRNNTSRAAEGTWFLPLPNGAVADAFTMSVGGEEIRGEVLDAGQARQVYESIVRRRRDPGLLEYAGEGMLRARIFPIPANGEVGVTVRFRQVLEPTGGMYEWAFPLRTAKLGDASAGTVGLDVRIASQTPLSSIVTPHPNAEIRRDGDRRATVSLEGRNGDFEDLRVLYGLTRSEFGLHLLPYRMAGDPGYFAMLLSPPRTLADDKVPPRLVQIVVDTSGSMKGEKIAQAKASLRVFLGSLRSEDHFQILTFASSVQRFFDAPRQATEENVQQALARVDTLEAMGGTNIAEALREALENAAPADDGAAMLPQIVFVTDGEPTVGLTKPNEILALTKQSDRSRTRLFALGVGDHIDVRLIDDLVDQHHGARDFVGNREKIEAKVDALCQKISRPALTDVVVKCEGLDSYDVHPSTTRDLFCGEMLQVVGRYRDHGVRTVRVSGSQNGEPKEFVFEVEFPKASAKHDFVQTLWARQHVAGLLDAIRHNGRKPELVQEVKSLATRYGIVTPFTSQLIVEEGMRLANQPTPTRRVDRQRGFRKVYRGPGDATPPGSGGGGNSGPIPSTGGPVGPRGPVPSGPATGGPSGPVSRGPTGPVSGGRPSPVAGAPARERLGRLGEARTGKQAIEESKALRPVTGSTDFYLGSNRRGEADDSKDRADGAALRRAAGRVFLTVGEDLVEQGLPKDWLEKAVVVEAFSKDYFALLKAKPELKQILALGERVVFRDGERIVHVRPVAAKEPAPKKEGPKQESPEKGDAKVEAAGKRG